ncbi:phosphatidate cytidylyltransferase [Catonella morbi ATCC 51271]|uniref:Phosphatidate cytidylyltransferase n=1 Tax=Catonella morbi ATCC 51271 TaxID=592026 RepID=V2YA74_9FIRM|nr:phosphatidate cytidylyltransferase [Catonella morbi]ESL04561.1 phosphatidate cytidylyltransferase [Catonella morbi ATCC 51271]
MFLTRLISGILLLAFTFVTMFFGGQLLLITLFMISLIGLYELYKVMKFENTPLACVGYLGAFAWYLNIDTKPNAILDIKVPELMIFSIVVVAALLVFVVKYPKYSANQLFSTIFGIFYIPVMISFIFKTRETIAFGRWLAWMVYVSSWGSDTCAYAVGRLFGRHKLAPNLSPKKSVEGSVGGIIGSALIGVIFGLIMSNFTGKSENLIIIFAVIGGLGSVISQIGDLAASGIKRNYDIKDYGHLIPGHGGILDRYDSIIITAPIVYFLSLYLVGRI